MTFYREHLRYYSDVGGESLTKQSFQAECDINNILKKYQKTGLLTHVAQYQGRYEDLPSELDYQESLNAIIAAEESFSSLPSSVRARFGNDPAEFLAFVENPANENEMVTLGLATARQPESSPSRVATPSLPGESPDLKEAP